VNNEILSFAAGANSRWWLVSAPALIH